MVSLPEVQQEKQIRLISWMKEHLYSPIRDGEQRKLTPPPSCAAATHVYVCVPQSDEQDRLVRQILTLLYFLYLSVLHALFESSENYYQIPTLCQALIQTLHQKMCHNDQKSESKEIESLYILKTLIRPVFLVKRQ